MGWSASGRLQAVGAPSSYRISQSRCPTRPRAGRRTPSSCGRGSATRTGGSCSRTISSGRSSVRLSSSRAGLTTSARSSAQTSSPTEPRGRLITFNLTASRCGLPREARVTRRVRCPGRNTGPRWWEGIPYRPRDRTAWPRSTRRRSSFVSSAMRGSRSVSGDAQPDGFPDTISFFWSRSVPAARMKAVERGRADVALGFRYPPLSKEQIDRAAVRYPSRLHVNTPLDTASSS